MGSSAQSPRYRWREEKETDLRDYVESRVRDGVSKTQALKEYGERNKMSWLTARWKYYQVRNQTAAPRPEVALAHAPGTGGREGAPRASSPDDDFLGSLQDLLLATEESGQDIVPFIKGFSRMAVLSRESMRLRDEVALLKERLKAAQTSLREHCGHVGQWVGKTQVERVSCLKEFSDLMERDLSVLEGLLERLAE